MEIIKESKPRYVVTIDEWTCDWAHEICNEILNIRNQHITVRELELLMGCKLEIMVLPKSYVMRGDGDWQDGDEEFSVKAVFDNLEDAALFKMKFTVAA